MKEEKTVRELGLLIGEKLFAGNLFERLSYGQDEAQLSMNSPRSKLWGITSAQPYYADKEECY
jgi:hypothetical protein